ncbi:hypothetical protein [Brucella intermedia]|uniref:hypothetical protein n=1 Tax=Brucella intermedia TaxID=94625 RepID=UPI00124DF92A|nr:hypothetical protein [Brucella intermedia]KAB2730714.1 hypothetical protein F9L02_11730 [Brucella intermedia]
MTYPSHPLADIFPMIAEADLKVLAADIAANGQVEPILLLEGKVLDGRNRQAACGLAGVDPVYAEFTGADPLSFVLSKNLHRRHLTESQRAMAAAMVVDWERGINQATARDANLPVWKAAQKFNVSHGLVGMAKRVKRDGIPELISAVKNGKVRVHRASHVARQGRAEQLRLLSNAADKSSPDRGLLRLSNGRQLTDIRWGELRSISEKFEREARLLRAIAAYAENIDTAQIVGTALPRSVIVAIVNREFGGGIK